MFGLLTRLPVEWQMGIGAGLVIAGLAAFGGTYLAGDHQGFTRADLEWRTKWAEREAELNQQRIDELARQAAANEAAKAAEAAALAAYQEQVEDLAARNAELSAEAAAAPGHDDVVFDEGAVGRYNRSISK